MFAGYGSGKTTALLARAMIDKFVIAPDSDIAIYNPTYDLIRLNIVPRLEHLLNKMPVLWKHDKISNTIKINNFGKIIFRTLDNPDRIVAYEVFRSYVDELDTLPSKKAEEAWNKIIARNRQVVKSKAENRVYAFSTPEGFKFCYKMWVKNAKENKDYQYVTARTSDNPYLPEPYIQSMRDTYPEPLLAAYLEGKFVNLTSGSVFYAYTRKENNTIKTKRLGERLLIGMDFNVGKQCAVVHIERRNKIYAVEELVDMYDTPAAIKIIKEKYPRHHITIYPDASGNARKTVNASVSDIKLLRSAGFRVLAKKKNPFVKDRILATNIALQEKKYFVNASACPELAEAFEQLAYDKNGMPDKASDLDHLTDAASYLISYRMPVKSNLSSLRKYKDRNWK
jgi:PBSX family phage terminase large subunit